MSDVDVLVVGSGAAGLAAALSARENGADSVIIAEAEDVVGGSSRLAGGKILAAGTRYQRAQGIDDSGDALFHHYMAINQWAVDAGIVRRFAEMAGPTLEWVADHGVEFYPEVMVGSDENVPRVHVPVGEGEAFIEGLRRACSRAGGIDIAFGLRVDRLLVENGRVVGAAVGRDEIRAGSTVMATGGFGADGELLRTFYPSAGDVPGSWYIGASGVRGDAISLAHQVDAQFTGEDRGLRLLDPGFGRGLESELPGWLVLVNGSGHRFVAETAPYGIVDGRVRDNQDEVFVVFSEASIAAESTGGRGRYKRHDPSRENLQSPNWTRDVVAEEVANGRVRKAPTLEALAADLGLPAAAFVGEMTRYNEFARTGEDRDFLKPATFLDPLQDPPFYGAALRPATTCLTAYGPRIDADARVLGEEGRPVPGLLAAGECAGGVLGDIYVGSGNSYASCLVFGRIAGAVAAGAAAPLAAAERG